MPIFVPGLVLSQRFYEQIVRPILDTAYPDLQYAATLISPGSESLSFDIEMSMDYDWGVHFSIFLKGDNADLTNDIDILLSHQLPPKYSGRQVSIPTSAQSPGFHTKERSLDGPIKHHIIITTVNDGIRRLLGYDLTKPLRAVDWLTLPPHAIGEVVAGDVFHDGTGELTAFRDKLAWYPQDVWLYLMASVWNRVG